MKTLWFKGEFVSPILSGAKTDTVRRPSTRLPQIGESVAFAVGPRPAFAHATIIGCERITVKGLPVGRRKALRALYGDSVLSPEGLVLLQFRLVPTHRDAKQTGS